MTAIVNENEKQLRYLAQSIRLKEAASPKIVRATMSVASFSVLMFFIWAAFADIHEIAHTPGEIVPSGFQQVVQHFDGGIVRQILVHDGETVDKDQVLLRLDGAGIEEDLARALEQKQAYDMQEERLRAFIDGRVPDFETDAGASENAIRDQQAFFRNMEDARQKEADIINDQIAQKRKSTGVLSADLETARQNFIIIKDLYARSEELHRRGYMSEMKLLEARQQYNQLQGQIRNIESQIGMAKSAIAEYQSRLSSLSANSVGVASEKLDSLITASAQNDQVIEKLKGRVARLDVKSPVKGVVKGLTVNTIGSVVLPGQALMEIIPTDVPLVVSLKIPPKYAGHIREGQPVQIKISSFDFSRYGSVRGKLDFISAATFTSENGERYYQGRALLDQDYAGNDPRNKVMPGMTVMADIITGDKTVLQYLLKPIRNAFSTAFTER